MSAVIGNVSASQYLREILDREAVGRDAALARAGQKIATLCHSWGGDDIIEVTQGGGYEKGLANRSGISTDYVVWFHTRSGRRIADIYESMFQSFARLGLQPVRRHVTIALDVGGAVIDLLPVKRLSMLSDIHEIYSARRHIPLTTNLTQHVLDSHSAGWRDEVRILKLWRDQNGLDFPSFYLELAAVAALRRRQPGELADNVWAVLGFLERLLVPRAMLDPANAANIVSDELTSPQKRSIAATAAAARDGRPWSEIVW